MLLNKEKLIRRLKQPSTWRGIVVSFGQMAAFFEPKTWVLITAVSLIIAGLIGVLTDDYVEDKSVVKEIANVAANSVQNVLQQDKK